MKKIMFAFTIFMLANFLFSCFSLPTEKPVNTKNKSETSWIFGINNTKLIKNQIIYRDNPAGLPDEAKTDLFGKINWFSSLLETFNLHETLSFAQKEELFNALFGFIPAGPTDDFYRTVAIGEYFSDKSPLILYARVYRPSARAPSGSIGILDFTANFAAYRNNRTESVDFMPMNGLIVPNMNWSSNGVVFADGSIIKASDLFSKENENNVIEEAGDNIYLQYVNLADSYIKDEIKTNDNRALEMLNEAFTHSDDPTIRITAKLNTFLYYLYKQNVNNAEKALLTASELLRESKNDNPSFDRVINIEAPIILELYKNNMAQN